MSRYSPEELLVASLSACHMLWVLHLGAEAGIAVTEYRDQASGEMAENEDGSGQFAIGNIEAAYDHHRLGTNRRRDADS